MRNLRRKPSNTFFTIFAICLGVALVVSVNISAESMIYSIDEGLSQQFGYTDIILKENKSWGLFDYPDMESTLDKIDNIDSIVPRIVWGRTVRTNVSTTDDTWADVIAINHTDPNERNFGKILVNETQKEYENFTMIEDFLSIPGNSCVVSQSFANYYDLSPGDDVYIHASWMELLGQWWWDTSTWSRFTIRALIIDSGEAARDFTPPVTEDWELEPPGWGIYIPLDIGYQYVFNTHEQNVSYVNIHVKDLSLIDETIEEIYTVLNESIEFSGMEFYQVNAKETFQGSIKEFSSIIISLFTIISFLALLVSAILIKNLMEMSTQSQMYYTGILRSMGSSKFRIFKIFFTELFTISFIGTITGVFAGILMSNLFIEQYGTMLTESGLLSQLVFIVDYQMQAIITPTPIIYGIIGGLTIPIIFGIIPIVKSANIKVIKAIKPSLFENGSHRGLKTGKTIIGVVISIIFILFGFNASKYGFENAFSILSKYPNTTSLIFVILGFISLVLGIILLGTKILPGISYMITILSVLLLGNLRKLTHQNVIRNKKQTKNTFAMLSLGLSLMVTLTLILSSLNGGAYPGAKTQNGGDLLIGNPWGWMNGENNLSVQIENIEGVVDSCAIKKFWGTIDGFGDKTNEAGFYEELLIYAVNITQYRELIKDPDMFKEISGDNTNNIDEILSYLEGGGGIILQNDIQGFINQTINDNVTLNLYGSKNLTIYGFADILPGLQEFFWSSDTRVRVAALVSMEDYLDQTKETAFMVTVESRGDIVNIISSIKELYIENGYTWYTDGVSDASNIMDELLMVVGMLQSVFQSIFSFALLISLLGLIVSMAISVNKRKAEIGTMRAIGGSKYQLIKLVFGETLVISLMGIILGITTGITISYILVENIGFIPLIPMRFTIPVDFMVSLSSTLILVSLLTSIAPAYIAMRFDIIESIRARE